jgi:SAM-dependent methyltransferase
MALEAATALPGALSRLAPDEDPATRPHRLAMGGQWDAIGPWAADFLRRQGLESQHFFLDLGCGSLPVALHVLPLMAPTRYWGVDGDRELFDAGVRLELWRAGIAAERGHFVISPDYDMSACPHPFDMGLVHSLAHRLPPDRLAQVVATAIAHLVPGGRLFVSLPGDHAAHREAIERMAEVLGVGLHAVDDAGAPDGARVLRVTRALAA